MAAVPATEWLARLEQERDEGPYLCPHPDCDRDFESRGGLRAHLRAIHDDQVPGSNGGGSVPGYACPECGEMFERAQGRGVHRRFAHGVASSNSHANKPSGARAQGRVVAVAPAAPGIQEIKEPEKPEPARVVARFYVSVAVLGLVEFAEAQGPRPQIRPCDDGSFELVVEAAR